jgi:formiminoglutamase
MIGTMNLFDSQYTHPPEEELFYSRHDVNNVRLGDLAHHATHDYAEAQVVLLGCPQDEGVQRNGGRPGAHAAPHEIRRCLYRLALGDLSAELHLFDLGDTVIQPTLEETHALQQKLVTQIIRDGKRLIVLGGGNDISYPDCSGLAQAQGDVVACNIDAHFDVRADQPRNSGTPYRQLLEEGYVSPERFYEIGYQPFSNSPVYEQYLRYMGAHLLSRNALREAGAAESVRRVLGNLPEDGFSLFWGFDMDVVCASDAPGVSAPNPTGLSGTELCEIARLAGAHPHTRLVEFSEVNPSFDIDLRTSRLTAAAIWHYLSAMNRKPADERV